MHQLLRAGNHQLVDLSAPHAEFGPLTANFGTVCNARTLLRDNVLTDQTAVGDQFAMSVQKDISETWTQALGDTFCFGRFINGSNQVGPTDKILIGVGGSIVINLTANVAVDVSLCVGRLQNGSPVVDLVNADANPVDNQQVISARDRHEDAGMLRVDAEATLIDGLFDGAVSTTETNPLAVYWRIDAYGAITITGMRANLWAWSYRDTLDTYDPQR